MQTRCISAHYTKKDDRLHRIVCLHCWRERKQREEDEREFEIIFLENENHQLRCENETLRELLKRAGVQ